MISLAEALASTARGLSFEAAIDTIVATAKPLPSEGSALQDAQGRTLGEPVTALRDQPPTALSAMDGYAVRAAETGAPLILDGATPAGTPAGTALSPGAARRIFTGAPLPMGADAVLIQEEAEIIDGNLQAKTPIPPGAFVRPRGFDFRAGEALLTAGRVLDARALALAAAANTATVTVRCLPRIGILATGAELRTPGKAMAPEHVVASNALALQALLNQAGAVAQDQGFVSDDVAAIKTALQSARDNADLILTTGGASVGDHDLVQAALHELGARPAFWQIMMRPGKPVFLWDWAGTPVLGLPGNPVSAYVCARVLALPWVRAALGQHTLHEPRQPLALAAPLAANGPRHQFARATRTPTGLVPASSQDSSLLRTLAQADVLIERRPHAEALAAGQSVQALLL